MKLIIAFPYSRRRTAYNIQKQINQNHPDIPITIMHHMNKLRDSSNAQTIIFTDGLGEDPLEFFAKAQPIQCLTVLLYVPAKLQITSAMVGRWCSGIIPEYASHLIIRKLSNIKAAVEKS